MVAHYNLGNIFSFSHSDFGMSLNRLEVCKETNSKLFLILEDFMNSGSLNVELLI